MASQAMLRASDADRDAVIERLRAATAEGRLDAEELDERLDAALRARTYGELERLVADLPMSDALPWRRRRAQVVPAARSTLAAAFPILVTAAVVTAVVVAVAVAAAWWAVWVLVWFFMCGRRGCSTRRLGAGSQRYRRTSAHAMQRTRPAGLH